MKKTFILIYLIGGVILSSCNAQNIDIITPKITITILNQEINSEEDTIEYVIQNVSEQIVYLPLDYSNFIRLDNLSNIDGIINFLEPNFEIQNSKKHIQTSGFSSAFIDENDFNQAMLLLKEYHEKQDSILKQYKDDRYSKERIINQNYIEENLIKLNPAEAINLKTPIEINYYRRKHASWVQYYILNKDEKYTLRIKLSIDSKMIKENLPDNKTKDLILTGDYYSNSIPIKVIEFW